MVLGASVLPAVCTTAIGDTRAHHTGVSINPLVPGHSHRSSTSGPCRMDSLRNLQIFCVTLYNHHVFIYDLSLYLCYGYTTTLLRTQHLSDVGHFFPSGFFPYVIYHDLSTTTLLDGLGQFFPTGFFPLRHFPLHNRTCLVSTCQKSGGHSIITTTKSDRDFRHSRSRPDTPEVGRPSEQEVLFLGLLPHFRTISGLPLQSYLY